MLLKILFKLISFSISEVFVVLWLLFNLADGSWSSSSVMDRAPFLAVLGAPDIQNSDKVHLGVVLGTAFSADDI